jgi:uncharacterized protein YciI
VACPASDRADCCKRVRLGPLVSEEQLEELLELEHRSFAGAAEPLPEGSSAGRRDRVDRAGTASGVLLGGDRKSARGKGAFAQPGVNDHSAFMNGLSDDGFALLAGPVAGSENDRIGVLLIADADSEADIRRRLVDDPWERSQQVVTTSVDPWILFVGADRIRAEPAVR